jgi:hypothetical protein
MGNGKWEMGNGIAHRTNYLFSRDCFIGNAEDNIFPVFLFFRYYGYTYWGTLG